MGLSPVRRLSLRTAQRAMGVCDGALAPCRAVSRMATPNVASRANSFLTRILTGACSRRCALALVVCAGLALVACSGDDPTSRALDATPPADTAPDGMVVIAITADGFRPESLELREGDRLTVRNETDKKVSVVVAGTSDDNTPGGGGTPQDIEPKGLLRLGFDKPGAQLLTLDGNPDFAATVMVIPGEGAR